MFTEFFYVPVIFLYTLLLLIHWILRTLLEIATIIEGHRFALILYVRYDMILYDMIGYDRIGQDKL